MLLTHLGIRSAAEVGAMLAVVVLSTLACVIVLFLFDGVLQSIRPFSLGVVLGMGAFIVLSGFPGTKVPIKVGTKQG